MYAKAFLLCGSCNRFCRSVPDGKSMMLVRITKFMVSVSLMERFELRDMVIDGSIEPSRVVFVELNCERDCINVYEVPSRCSSVCKQYLSPGLSTVTSFNLCLIVRAQREQGFGWGFSNIPQDMPASTSIVSIGETAEEALIFRWWIDPDKGSKLLILVSADLQVHKRSPLGNPM